MTDIANEVATDVIMRNLNECSGSTTQIMRNTNAGISLFGTSKQTASVDVSCVNNFQMTADIATQISSAIQQEAAKQGQALIDPLNFETAEASVKLRNLVSTKITNEVIQRTKADVMQVMENKNLGIEIFTLMKSISDTGFGLDVSTQVYQKATTEKKNPLSFIFDNLMWIVAAFVLLIVAVVAVIFLT
jgi:hypothetical protein